MLFNSPTFVLFFVAVFALYWGLRDRRRQNLLLLAASYVFYGAWSWLFLGLLLLSTLMDYGCARWLDALAAPRARRRVLVLSIATNLGLLGTFKYFGFFVDQAAALIEALGFQAHLPVLRVVLPVGISFYTFQSLGYVIDVYRRKVPASRSLSEYALYVAFFPQLVAGPIERAAHMLPQYRRERSWNGGAFESGLVLILWGLVKKVVVADNLAPYVNAVFAAPEQQSGAAVAMAVVFFAFQIYGDFSGYSDTARGLARTLGFDLLRNFDHPYTAHNPVDFWRRWHISLSQWFQDYLYFPLAMRFMRSGAGWLGRYGAHIVSMGLIGLWHGASWTFVVFGLYWGVAIAGYLMIGERLAARAPAVATPATLPMIAAAARRRLGGAASIAITFVMVCIGWVFFRASSLSQAWQVFGQMLGAPIADGPRRELPTVGLGLLLIGGLLVAEWLVRRRPAALQPQWSSMMVLRYAMVGAIVFSYVVLQGMQALPFIYFQF